MDSAQVVKMIFGIVGGLGIFLLGMKNMSEGMQAVAGERLRRLIGLVTNNRLVGCGVGTAVTCMVQSSSVTTVMVVGMVNAGIMTLFQAISVIMGANIGTTITGWILVLKIGRYGLPILGFSAFFFLFAKRDRVRYTAMMLMGLGMVFYGLELMKLGFKPLSVMPGFKDWFARFTPDTYLGVLRCCMVGALLTAIVQSSSATLGITIALAFEGGISFETAAALVLGENIGTTITAYLASLGASTNAKRASYAHILFNVCGVLWITAIFHLYVKFVPWVLGGGDPALPFLDDAGNTVFPNTTKCIAAIHTGFNVVNAALFLPFASMMARLLTKLAPDRTEREVPHLTFLDVRMFDTPALGIEQSKKEILRMAEGVEKMLDRLGVCLNEPERDETRETKIFHREELLDVFQKEVVEFISHLMTGNIPHEVMEKGRGQLRMADEYESISDLVRDILKLHLKMRKTNQKISPGGLQDLLELHGKATEYVKLVNDAVRRDYREILSKANARGNAIKHIVKECRNRHLARVSNGDVAPLKSLIYTDMLTAYRGIRDHALNIAEVVAGEK